MTEHEIGQALAVQHGLAAMSQRIASLERELANEKAKHIHSCHADCTRDGCVNRRLREELAAIETALVLPDGVHTTLEVVRGLRNDYHQAKNELADSQAVIAKKDEALKGTKQAFSEIHHAFINPNWFTNGQRAASQHLLLWVQTGSTAATEALALPSDRTCLDAMLAEARKEGMLRAERRAADAAIANTEGSGL